MRILRIFAAMLLVGCLAGCESKTVTVEISKTRESPVEAKAAASAAESGADEQARYLRARRAAYRAYDKAKADAQIELWRDTDLALAKYLNGETSTYTGITEEEASAKYSKTLVAAWAELLKARNAAAKGGTP